MSAGQHSPLTEDRGYEEYLEEVLSALRVGALTTERRTKGAVSHRFVPLTVTRRQHRLGPSTYTNLTTKVDRPT